MGCVWVAYGGPEMYNITTAKSINNTAMCQQQTIDIKNLIQEQKNNISGNTTFLSWGTIQGREEPNR